MITLYIEHLLLIPPFKKVVDGSKQQLAVSTAAAALTGCVPLGSGGDLKGRATKAGKGMV